MNAGRTVFDQLIEHLPPMNFGNASPAAVETVTRRTFPAGTSIWHLAFAQLTDRETCLGAVGIRLHHMGFRVSVARSTLADANERVTGTFTPTSHRH